MPLWLFSWALQLERLANATPQNLQAYGFSPVWVFLWSLSFWLSRKPFPHISHLYFLSWFAVCFTCTWWNNFFLATISPQTGQGLMLWVEFTWVFKCWTDRKISPHSSHGMSSFMCLYCRWDTRFFTVTPHKSHIWGDFGTLGLGSVTFRFVNTRSARFFWWTIRRWSFKASVFINNSWHSPHLIKRWPLCIWCKCNEYWS